MRNWVQTAGKGCCSPAAAPCFSLGNLVSARGQRQGYHVLQLVPWGMVYRVVLLLAGSPCSASSW